MPDILMISGDKRTLGNITTTHTAAPRIIEFTYTGLIYRSGRGRKSALIRIPAEDRRL